MNIARNNKTEVILYLGVINKIFMALSVLKLDIQFWHLKKAVDNCLTNSVKQEFYLTLRLTGETKQALTMVMRYKACVAQDETTIYYGLPGGETKQFPKGWKFSKL